MEICVSLSSYHGQRRASWIDAITGFDPLLTLPTVLTSSATSTGCTWLFSSFLMRTTCSTGRTWLFSSFLMRTTCSTMAQAARSSRRSNATHTLNSLGRGAGRGRGRGGGARSASNDAHMEGGGRGAVRGHRNRDVRVCFTCNGIGHHQDVCSNNVQASEGQAATPQRKAANLRALSYQISQADDDGSFYGTETGREPTGQRGRVQFYE